MYINSNMNMKINRRRIKSFVCASLLMATATLSSCTGGIQGNSPLIPTGDSTVVHVKLETSAPYSSSTRTLSSSNENKIDNLYILVFDAAGKLVGGKYTSFATSPEQSFTSDVTVHENAVCTICAIANVPESAFSGVTSQKGLNAAAQNIGTATDLAGNNDIVMFGKTQPVDVSSITDTNIPNLTLERIADRLDISITPGTGIAITGYQLCSVPASSYLADSTSESRYNPSGKYVDFPAVSGQKYTSSFTNIYYTYENLAGKNANATTQEQRITANAPANASYITIWAEGSNWKSEYKIYIGGPADDSTDYDIERNSRYTYNIEINGQGANDVRVIETTAIITGSTVSGWQNESGGSASGIN